MSEEEKEEYIKNNKEIINLYTGRNEYVLNNNKLKDKLKDKLLYETMLNSFNDTISKLTDFILNYEEKYEKEINDHISKIDVEKEINMTEIKKNNEEIESIYNYIITLGPDDNSKADEILELCSNAEEMKKEKINKNYINVVLLNDINILKNELSNFEYIAKINYDIRNNLLDKYIRIKFSNDTNMSKFDDKNENLQEILIQQNKILNFQTFEDEKNQENYVKLTEEINKLQKLQIENSKSDESRDLEQQLEFVKSFRAQFENMYDENYKAIVTECDKEIENINKRIHNLRQKVKDRKKLYEWIENRYLKKTLGDGNCFYSAIFRGLRDIYKKNPTGKNNVLKILGVDLDGNEYIPGTENLPEPVPEQLRNIRNFAQSFLPEYIKNNLYNDILKNKRWADGVEVEHMRNILKDTLGIEMNCISQAGVLESYNINNLNNLYIYNPDGIYHFSYFFNNSNNDGKKRHSAKRRSKRHSAKIRSKRKSLKRRSKRKSLKRRSKRKSLKRRSKRHSLKRRSKRKIDL